MDEYQSRKHYEPAPQLRTLGCLHGHSTLAFEPVEAELCRE